MLRLQSVTIANCAPAKGNYSKKYNSKFTNTKPSNLTVFNAETGITTYVKAKPPKYGVKRERYKVLDIHNKPDLFDEIRRARANASKTALNAPRKRNAGKVKGSAPTLSKYEPVASLNQSVKVSYKKHRKIVL